MYDVIIVGGGPAGSTLARLIGKRYKVLLVEKRSFSTDRFKNSYKCCGGLIAPDAQLMLAKFGLGLPKSVLFSPQLFAVRTIDIDNSREKYYQRNYINIDREEFDKWLLSIVPDGVKLMMGAIFSSYTQSNDCLEVKINYKNKEIIEKTKFLIAADGANSKIRRKYFPDCAFPKSYITIQEWFKTTKRSGYYGAIFDREITDFYSWTIPKEDNIIIGTAIDIKDNPIKKFDLLKEKLKKYGFELDKPVYKNGAYVYRPISNKQILIGNGKVFFIGEASGFISPSSAEGLSYAFRSALALANSLDGELENCYNMYKTNIKPLERNILLKNLKLPCMYNKYIRNIIMKTGLMTVDVEKI